MNDQELLQLAAKAAGGHIYFDVDGGCYLVKSRRVVELWDPLTYDSDAFRLMVKLNLYVQQNVNSDYPNEFGCYCGAKITTKYSDIGFECWDKDPCTATRRAIVRVAAEIGKAKGEK